MASRRALPQSLRVILVVDDDESTRHAVGAALCRHGYEVVLASSGEQARVLIAVLDQLDGLYTDIDLGGATDGWQVGEAFHRKWPTCPIVYASGRESRNARILATGTFLLKPFALETVVEAFAK